MNWINEAVRSVGELPDRSSPRDWPDAMLVTPDELQAILTELAREHHLVVICCEDKEYDALVERRNALAGENLQHDQTLAQSKRDFFAGDGGLSAVERAEIELSIAQNRRAIHLLSLAIADEKKARRGREVVAS